MVWVCSVVPARHVCVYNTGFKANFCLPLLARWIAWVHVHTLVTVPSLGSGMRESAERLQYEYRRTCRARREVPREK